MLIAKKRPPKALIIGYKKDLSQAWVAILDIDKAILFGNASKGLARPEVFGYLQGCHHRFALLDIGREIARGQLMADPHGLLKLLFHPESRRLLGVHIIGTGATELIHIGQTVMAAGMSIDYFIEAVFNYPTLAECYKSAAFNGLNKLTRY